ncbi:MAG TPA: diguanylate cyclase [Rectinemataceae bacterium]|nr:diguanylate cyclase [Rectinemataceae bacterium]
MKGELEDTEYQFKNRDGSTLWGSVSAKLVSGADEEKLISLSIMDDLTNLLNRRGFTIAAQQEVKHSLRRKEGIALLFFDIDNLKVIKDTFGHLAGDEAIKIATKT